MARKEYDGDGSLRSFANKHKSGPAKFSPGKSPLRQINETDVTRSHNN